MSNHEAVAARIAADSAGAYRVERLAAMDGDGSLVFLGTDTASSQPVMIKAWPPDFTSVAGADKLVARARAAAALVHPNIVAIRHVSPPAELVWYAMDGADGQTLDLWLRSRAPLPLREATPLLAGIAAALDYAHAQGALHLDVKPDNIVVDPAGVVRLTGFRMTAPDDSSLLTDPGVLIGAPHYLAPEQITGSQLTSATDQFALAVVAWELLTGVLPFTGDHTMQQVMARIMGPAPSIAAVRADLAGSVDAAFQRALAPKPADRFPSVDGFVAGLERRDG